MSANFFTSTLHTVPAQHIRGYYRSTANSQEEILQLAVKHYTPLKNVKPQAGDVTIVACHAAGFFKELYEPFFDDLLVALNKVNVRVRGIWIADACSHGESSVQNEGKLGNEPSWDDHARDLLHMTNVFRDEMPRPIVGVGHSMGGTQIIQLALLHPRLFSSVVCIEPIINKRHKGMNFAPAYGLSYQNDVWSSKEEAASKAKKSPMLKTWDARVLGLYLKHAFRELPTLLYPEMAKHEKVPESNSPVTLKTSKHHNVTSYARAAFPEPGQSLHSFQPDPRSHIDLSRAEAEEMQAPVYRPEAILTFRQLENLRPSCCFLYGASSPFSSATPQGRADKLGVTGMAVGGSGGVPAGRVSEAVLQGGGHFIVFEKPAAVAEEVSQWLKQELDRWTREEQAETNEWQKVGLREKAMVDDRWMFWVKEHYGKRRQGAAKKPAAKM